MVSIGGRPQVKLGGWFLFSAYVHAVCSFAQLVAYVESPRVNLYRTVQYSSIGLGGRMILQRWRQLFV